MEFLFEKKMSVTTLYCLSEKINIITGNHEF